jgi:hypothetical protein
MENFSGKILICIADTGTLKERCKYYCFADEGHDFWIHAPFLLETYGVTQLKCSGEFRGHFKLEP